MQENLVAYDALLLTSKNPPFLNAQLFDKKMATLPLLEVVHCEHNDAPALCIAALLQSFPNFFIISDRARKFRTDLPQRNWNQVNWFVEFLCFHRCQLSFVQFFAT